MIKRFLILSALALTTLTANSRDERLFTLYTFNDWNHCFRVITMPYSWFVRNGVAKLEEGNVESGALHGFWLVPANTPPPCGAE